jgi:hypothetical protein
MKQTDAARLVGIIRAAWPVGMFPPESVAVYAKAISDLDFDAVSAAVDELVKTRPFLPSIAMIRETVAERACGFLGTEEAWLEVEAAIRKFDGGCSDTWTWDWSSSVVAMAVRSLGGVSVMHEAPQLGFVRRDFADVYGKLRRKAVCQEAMRLGCGSPPVQMIGAPS